jgi:hypothetical protein
MSRVLMIAFAAACAGSRGGASGEATFRIFYPDAPVKATVGKRFQVKPVGSCVYANGRDARWSMTGARVAGELPPGLAIEDGAIGGVPSKPGPFTIEVTFSGVVCAGTAREPQVVHVPITITAKRSP